MTLIDVEADVARGVALLDERDPDWLYEVDLESLNMADDSHCVAGQQPGGFVETLIRLGLAERTPLSGFSSGTRVHWSDARDHGFVAGSRQEYEQQERVWLRIITERRATDAVQATLDRLTDLPE